MAEDALDNSIFDLPPDGNPFEEAPAEPEPEPEPEEPQEPQEGAEAQEEAEEGEVSDKKPQIFDLKDDDMVTILQDGKSVPVRWGDYKGHVMRLADYTRKTQKVAERESAIERREKEVEEAATLLSQREEKLLQIMRSPEKLAKLYRLATNGQPLPEEKAKAEAESDLLVTRGELAQLKEQMLEEAREQLRAEREAQEREQIEFAQRKAREAFIAEVRTTTEKTLDEIFADEEFKDTLADIPHVDTVIRKMAANYKPKNAEETREALIKAAKELKEQLGERSRETKKREAVRKAPLKKGIEPKGGTAPTRAPKKYADDASGWDELDKDVINWIQSKAA